MTTFAAMSLTTAMPVVNRSTALMLTAGSLSTTGTKAAITGRVWFPDRTGTKFIERVELLVSSTSISGGSGLTLSLQDPLLTEFLPDEVQDQTVDIPNAALPASGFGWVVTNPLSTARVVTYAELLSVVIEWDALGRQGTDVVGLSGVSESSGGLVYSAATAVKGTGGTWQHTARLPIVLLKFTDGTYGTLYGGLPCTSLPTILVSPSETYNEYGLQFNLTRDFEIDGAEWFGSLQDNTADGEVRLYQKGVDAPLATVAFDAHHQAITGSNERDAFMLFDQSIPCLATVNYRLVLKATAAAHIAMRAIAVQNAEHWTLHVGGQNWYSVGRQGGGAWTEIPLERAMIRPFLAGL